jgi:hypothetical protein
MGACDQGWPPFPVGIGLAFDTLARSFPSQRQKSALNVLYALRSDSKCTNK